MSFPLVTIIVTCYNRADMIRTALDSVWVQTYRPLELIIIDDGSKDNSMEVIETWIKDHPDTSDFTTVGKTFPNGKLCVARNRGLEMSNGELIQYVDDDDWLYPQAIEKKVALFQADARLDVIVNQVDYFKSPMHKIGSSKITISDDQSRQLLHVLDPKHETLFSPTLMIRKSILQSVGAWTPGLIFADDIDVVVRLAAVNARFGLVDEPLSAYLMHQQHRQCNVVIKQLPKDFWPDLFEKLFVYCQQHKQDKPEIRLAFGKMLDFYGVRQLRQGDIQAACKCFEKTTLINLKRNWRLRLPEFLKFRQLILFIEGSAVVNYKKIKYLIKAIQRSFIQN